jgi:menaquinone-9 beta-reductase
MTETLEASVIVVGAGPTGAAAAFFMAQAGLDVLLVDQATFPRDKSCGDSICPGAVGVLAKMGLLDWVQNEGYAQNVAYLLSSPKGNVARIPYPQDLAPYPNYLIPRKDFDYKLVQQAVMAGARLREGIRVTDFERLSPEKVRLQGENGSHSVTLTANLVVAADGSISAFTRKLNMMPGPADGVALRRYYAGVKGEPGRFELHWEKSVLPAYGFIFHLNDGIANVGTGMFRADLKRVGGSLKKRLDLFVTTNPHAREALAKAQPISPVIGHPYRDDAEEVTPFADNVLLVGDAAGAGHPMTGEGIGPGMMSAEMAAKTAVSAAARGDFSAASLAGYGDLFHAEFDGVHKISRLARQALRYPVMVDRTVKRCSHDPVFAQTMAGILAGVVSPGAMLKPGMVVRLLAG